MQIAFAGHLCLDVNIIGGRRRTACGGGVFFGGTAAANLGAEVTVYTKCTAHDLAHFSALHQAGVKVVRFESPRSTSCQNLYPSRHPDERTSRLLSRGAPFGAADVSLFAADILHLNSLWRGEMPPSLLPRLRDRTRVLGVDAQGLVRVVGQDGRLTLGDWPDKARYLPLFDLLKVGKWEAEVLSGEQTMPAAIARLHRLGVKTVMLTSADGVLVSHPGGQCQSAFAPYPLAGRTGRGDTCAAAFLVAVNHHSVAEATRLAAQVTSHKMQYPEPYRGERRVAAHRRSF